MGKLYGDSLESSLPDSIAHDKDVQNICTAIRDRLWRIKKQSDLLLLLPRLDDMDESLVDELAWEYHVDFYRPDLPVETKRNLIRQAISWHRIKGTPAAVEEVCSAVFKHAEVYENWQYGGEPYHFKVMVVKEDIPTVEIVETLIDAIEQTKNTRSWLDEIGFYREYISKSYWGSCLSKKIRVDAMAEILKIPKINKTLYINMTTIARKKYNLSQATFSLPGSFSISHNLAALGSKRTRFTIHTTCYKAPKISTVRYFSAIVNIFRRYING